MEQCGGRFSKHASRYHQTVEYVWKDLSDADSRPVQVTALKMWKPDNNITTAMLLQVNNSHVTKTLKETRCEAVDWVKLAHNTF